MPSGPVVLNNTPLVSLFLLDQFEILRHLYGEVLIPTAVQIDLLRAAGQARRSRLMLSRTQSAFDLSCHNIRHHYPHLSVKEQKMKLVELLYGDELASKLTTYLQDRNL